MFRLADVKPDTTIVREPDVAVDVRVPGGAVMLAGVVGNPEVLGVGVPVVTVKPLGSVTLIFDTEVGVVFNLKVTSISLPLDALIPRRPKRTPA